jgi:glycosidase
MAWRGRDLAVAEINSSPMDDFGYDVKDYRGIAEVFGSLADVDELLREAHSRKIKVILDLVLNHTSDLHPWFLDARSSKKSARRDWYICA